MKKNNEILTEERKTKLKVIKKRLREIKALEMSDLIAEIDRYREDNYVQAMEELALEIVDGDDEDNLDKITELYETTDMDSVVISKEDVFNTLIWTMEREVMDDAHKLLFEINQEIENPVFCVVRNGNFKFKSVRDNFESNNYDDSIKHALKKANKQQGNPFVAKSREAYEKQKSILAKILTVNTKEKTLSSLINYKFLDTTLYDIVKRLHQTVFTRNDVNLTFGGDIVSGLKNITKVKVPDEVDLVADVKERNKLKRDNNKAVNPSTKPHVASRN